MKRTADYGRMDEYNYAKAGALTADAPEHDRELDEGMSVICTDHLTHLQFLENMEKIDRAIRRADDLEQMLKSVLENVLSIFGAERAFLFYPCDPDAVSFSAPMECTGTEYPVAVESGFAHDCAPFLQSLSRDLLDKGGSISWGSGSEQSIPPEHAAQFSAKSMLCVPIFPKVGTAWAMGMQQCSRERIWSDDERQLFQEIGRCLTDSLGIFLTLRDLQKSESQYLAQLENIPGAFYRCDIENGWKIRFFSENIRQLTGYPPSYFVGHDMQKYIDLVHPDDRDMLKHCYEERIRKNKPIPIEYRVKDSFGTQRWVLSRGQPVFDAGGQACGLDGVICDITERKRTEEALRESEEKYRSLFQGSADATLLLDGDTFVDCNAAAVQMLRCKSKEDVLHKHPWDFSPKFQPDGRSSREKAAEFITSMPQERSRRFEWTHLRADGEPFPAEVMLTYIPVGDKYLINAVWRDLTEFKKTEKEAHLLKHLLGNIFDSMPSVLIGVDLDSNVTQWNRMAQNVTGISAEDALGKKLAEVYPQLAGQFNHIKQVIAGRELRSDSKVFSTVDGESRYSDITIYPLNANGTEGVVIRIDDVTERVQVEEMMVQSEKMLSVGGLAAGMAHEINNPLSGILQCVQVISDRLSAEMPANQKAADECGVSLDALNDYLQSRKIFNLLDGIRNSGLRAAKIVDNMLMFSRKSGSRFIRKNLAEIVDRTLELAAGDCVGKGGYKFRDIRIERHYDADLPGVPCEETEIQQVILNLLKNAAHAMVDRDEPHEPPCLTIRISQEEDMAKIEVQDNGPGMSEAVRRRVFEPFFTTKSLGVGTGLGLSVSYFIITEKHQGTLSVESAPEEGAKFTIRLPLEQTIIPGMNETIK